MLTKDLEKAEEMLDRYREYFSKVSLALVNKSCKKMDEIQKLMKVITKEVEEDNTK
jgi:hypothetical protein